MRSLRLTTTSVLLLLLAGCGGRGSLQVLGSSTTVVHLTDPGGVTIVDTRPARVVSRVDAGIPSGDWVFRTASTTPGSTLEAVGPEGQVAWSHTYDTRVTARVASFDGGLVALLPSEYRRVDPYHPTGRSSTKVVVSSTRGVADRSFELPGNFEPEAFTQRGDTLFLIEYLPAMQPDRYRVRGLDLESGAVGAVQSVDGHLQESMRGTARVSAMAPDGSRLYTLYTTDGLEGPHAFVHVLDLAGGWAHCVDLPHAFQATPESQLAIAVGGPGNAAVVVDAGGGQVVRIDPEKLVVERASSFQPLNGMASVHAAVDGHGTLYITRGNTIVTLSPSLEQPRYRGTLGISRGLFVDPTGDRLWQVTDRFLYGIDPVTGEVLDRVALPPSAAVDPVPTDDQVIKCAC